MLKEQLPSCAPLAVGTAVSFNKTPSHLPIGACQAIIFFMHDTHTKMSLCVFNTFTVGNNGAVLSGKVKKYFFQTQSNGKTAHSSAAVLPGRKGHAGFYQQGKGAKGGQAVVFLFKLKFTFLIKTFVQTSKVAWAHSILIFKCILGHCI